jgi:TetR/AcrR family transcriptional regulator, copper-responsive repressor
MGPYCLEGQKGCFAINSMREFAILPPKAVGIIARSRTRLKHLIARNIEVERPKANADTLAELILTFFTGLCMEHNLRPSRAAVVRKIENLMKIIRIH